MHPAPSSTPVIKCGKCGELLIAPDYSEFVDEYRVRHIWTCVPCDYSFEATIAGRPHNSQPDAGVQNRYAKAAASPTPANRH